MLPYMAETNEQTTTTTNYRCRWGRLSWIIKMVPKYNCMHPYIRGSRGRLNDRREDDVAAEVGARTMQPQAKESRKSIEAEEKRKHLEFPEGVQPC